MKNKDIVSVLGVTTAVLVLVSGIYTGETLWTVFDFALMGTLLIGTGLLVVFASRKITNVNRRAAVIVALVAGLMLVWAELAVGIFDTPFAGS